ncbi:MAG: ABC transporter substrate-binding protein [Planctomycetota bacterium]|jgi:ABC-type transport system substrate-binding protein
MDQNPIVGWLKILAFIVLAYWVALSVWQGDKLEEKLVALERTTAEAKERSRENERLLNQIAAANGVLTEQLTGLLENATLGGVGTTAAPTNGGGMTATDRPVRKTRRGGKEYSWERNAEIDGDLDSSRPLGTPGRYKNFLTPDPAGPAAFEGPHEENATLRLNWGSDPRGFNFVIENYATLSDSCELYVADSPAGRHWKRPSSFNYAPALCWRVEVNEDFTEYTLFFRKDAKWHLPPDIDFIKYPHLKGKHGVSARDLEFTLSAVKDPQSNAAVTRAYYDKLVSWDCVDDHTIVLKWAETQFTSLAASMGAQIMPRFVYAYDPRGNEYPPETVASEFNNHWYDLLRVGPAGCGPYRFIKYEPDKFIRLELNDGWYGFKTEPKYAIRNILFRIYTEPDTAQNWLRGGEVDLSGLSSTRYRQWVLEDKDPKSPFNDGRIRVRNEPRTGYLYFGWKNSDPMFSDVRVRKALTYACNRQEICEKIFLKRYTPMAAPIFPDSEEANPKLKPYPFDPEKSKELLDAAGWKLNKQTGKREKVINGKVTPFEFKLYWPGPSPEFQNALDHYKNDLQNIGIIMEPQSVQWSQFQTQLRDREYKAFTLLWVVGGWEHDFKQIWHRDQIEDPASSNYIEYDNQEVSDLSDKLRTTMDPRERIRIIHRIGEILYEEQPYTFFAWQRSYQASWTYLKGVDRRFFIRPFFRAFPLAIQR